MGSTRLYDQDRVFWENYMAGRPQVPKSFFDRIFAFHSERGGQFGTIHNAGAGAGVHSAQLSAIFDEVVVSDASLSNIRLAQQYLRDPTYSFRVAQIEDTTDVARETFDMVFTAVVLHLTDLDRAISAITYQLKSGGTFVAALFGFAVLDDSSAQKIWAQLHHAGFKQLIPTLGFECWKTVTQIQASGYDIILVPETDFYPDVQRIKLNDTQTSGGVWAGLLIPPELAHSLPYVSAIGRHERLIYEDDKDWTFHKDLAGLKNILRTMPFDIETDEMRALWTALETRVAPNVGINGRWPVSLILATKK